MPQPGDRSNGFFIERSRCWAFVCDHKSAGHALSRWPVTHGADGGFSRWIRSQLRGHPL
jgi:hypothetical protein